MIQKNDTTLIIDQTYLAMMGISLEDDSPKKIYKYFSDEDACTNMLQGNIWFTGPNQNRFYKDDPYEYNYNNHIWLDFYALSCSKKDSFPFPDMPYCVQISNIHEYMRAIRHDLKQTELMHSVSWIDKVKLLKIMTTRKKILKSLSGNEKLSSEIAAEYKELDFLTQRISNITYDLAIPLVTQSGSLCGRTIKYYDPAIPVAPLTLEAVHRASNLRQKFGVESEFRIELRTQFWLQTEPSLQHLVAHIKLNCPSTRAFLKKIDR